MGQNLLGRDIQQSTMTQVWLHLGNTKPQALIQVENALWMELQAMAMEERSAKEALSNFLNVGLEIKPMKKVQSNDHTLHHYLEYNPDPSFVVEYDPADIGLVDHMDQAQKISSEEQSSEEESDKRGLVGNAQVSPEIVTHNQPEVHTESTVQPTDEEVQMESPHLPKEPPLTEASVEHDEVSQFQKEIDALLERAGPPRSLNWPASDDTPLSDSNNLQAHFVALSAPLSTTSSSSQLSSNRTETSPLHLSASFESFSHGYSSGGQGVYSGYSSGFLSSFSGYEGGHSGSSLPASSTEIEKDNEDINEIPVLDLSTAKTPEVSLPINRPPSPKFTMDNFAVNFYVKSGDENETEGEDEKEIEDERKKERESNSHGYGTNKYIQISKEAYQDWLEETTIDVVDPKQSDKVQNIKDISKVYASKASDPENCALDADGNLLDPEHIQWQHDPDDNKVHLMFDEKRNVDEYMEAVPKKDEPMVEEGASDLINLDANNDIEANHRAFLILSAGLHLIVIAVRHSDRNKKKPQIVIKIDPPEPKKSKKKAESLVGKAGKKTQNLAASKSDKLSTGLPLLSESSD
uniref:Uncharacterized protein n=1 Tax=Moniliophthora roreri TaxID=221103 RepID=A0A0W0EZX1_MONRR